MWVWLIFGCISLAFAYYLGVLLVFACVCVYVCVCVCICVYLCVFVCICVYRYTDTDVCMDTGAADDGEQGGAVGRLQEPRNSHPGTAHAGQGVHRLNH